MKLTLDKIEKQAPELLSLVKSSQLSLEKNNLNEHVARVALMIDTSGSMYGMFKSGQVNELVKRALPLALQFDDDGQIDVFCFNNDAHSIGEYGIDNYKNCVSDIENGPGVGGGTVYHRALEVVEKFYEGTDLPVYLMFVTDGDTFEKEEATKTIKRLSGKPIFIQFIGLGEDYFPDQPEPHAKPKKGLLGRLFGSVSEGSRMSSGFKFLVDIDDMGGRVVDNANFFAIKKPTSIDDARLYELLLNEYPQWLKDMKARDIL